MNITDIRIRPVKKEDSKVKAIASVTLEDAIAIHDIRVVQGTESIFVSMPSKKMANGEFRDIVHPINAAAREELISAILKAYEEADKEVEN